MVAKPIRKDVKGAPFKIRMMVKVKELIDLTGDESLINLTGTVDHYEYSCGCGQTYPQDPMVGVRFPDGRVEEFWKEELQSLPKVK